MRRGLFFLPFALPFLMIFLLLPFLLAYVVLSVGWILGLSPIATLLVFMAILLGSAINIPILKMEKSEVIDPVIEESHPFFHISIPKEWMKRSKHITVNLNFGGAIIPIIISVYLLSTLTFTEIYAAMVATLIVVAVSKKFSRLVRGVGISMPMMIPPLTAVIASLLSVYAFGADTAELAKIAFTAGTVGVLIGADLLNLRKIKKLGVDMVSIGGAGTFDGIFLSGVFAALFSVFFM